MQINGMFQLQQHQNSLNNFLLEQTINVLLETFQQHKGLRILPSESSPSPEHILFQDGININKVCFLFPIRNPLLLQLQLLITPKSPINKGDLKAEKRCRVSLRQLQPISLKMQLLPARTPASLFHFTCCIKLVNVSITVEGVLVYSASSEMANRSGEVFLDHYCQLLLKQTRICYCEFACWLTIQDKMPGCFKVSILPFSGLT